MKKEELIERLIEYTAMVIALTDTIRHSRAGIHLIDQMSRSSISVALNYGEATDSESTRDFVHFVHKLQIVLKELKETWMALRITEKSQLSSNSDLLMKCLDENNQLISIFTKSVTTNKKKMTDL